MLKHEAHARFAGGGVASSSSRCRAGVRSFEPAIPVAASSCRTRMVRGARQARQESTRRSLDVLERLKLPNVFGDSANLDAHISLPIRRPAALASPADDFMTSVTSAKKREERRDGKGRLNLYWLLRFST